MGFNEFVRLFGANPETLTEEQRQAFNEAFRLRQQAGTTPTPLVFGAGLAVDAAAVTTGTPGTVGATNAAAPTQTVEQYRNQMIAEAERVAAIQKAAGTDAELYALALKNNWTPERVSNELELKTLRARLQNGPSQMPGNTVFTKGNIPAGATQSAILEAAMALALNGGDVKAIANNHQADVIQYARDQFKTNMTVSRLLMISAAANGMHFTPGERLNAGNLKQILTTAFAPAATFSGANVSGILSNIANKEILAGYMEEDQNWREIAAVKSNNDFKTVTAYRMLDNMKYEKVPAGGRIPHGTISQDSYTRAVDTYAKMFTLTRKDLINDDMSAFADLRDRLARGAAQAFNDLFWTTWLAAVGSFWTTARTNYIEGATTNLGADGVGLGLGVKAFRTMKSPGSSTPNADDGGKRLARTPTKIIVPPELETVAEALYKATNLATVKASDANIHGGKYKPVVVPQLSDSAYTNYSTTAWWLVCDPRTAAAVHVSFLNGNQTPIIEQADAEFDTLGVAFRGYHDFGVDMAEIYAAVRSKGAA